MIVSNRTLSSTILGYCAALSLIIEKEKRGNFGGTEVSHFSSDWCVEYGVCVVFVSWANRLVVPCRDTQHSKRKPLHPHEPTTKHTTQPFELVSRSTRFSLARLIDPSVEIDCGLDLPCPVGIVTSPLPPSSSSFPSTQKSRYPAIFATTIFTFPVPFERRFDHFGGGGC